MLHSHNSYVQIFKTALDKVPSDEYKLVIRADLRPTRKHPRRFNEPATNEVVIVVGGNKFDRRDIILEKKKQSVAESSRDAQIP